MACDAAFSVDCFAMICVLFRQTCFSVPCDAEEEDEAIRPILGECTALALEGSPWRIMIVLEIPDGLEWEA